MPEPPISELVNIYGEPLRETDIETSYNVDPQSISQAKEIQTTLTKDVNRVRESLGLFDIAPISLPKDKAEQLRQTIKSDRRWVGHYNDLVSLLSPNLDLTGTSDKIFLPWWNAPQIGLISDNYDGTKLKVNAAFSHSYLTQLVREKQPGLKLDPVSVSGVLLTADNLLVLGYRGGQSFGNSLMSVPAGSVEPHSGKNPVFESFYKELQEEAGLNPQDLESHGLVARALDHGLSEQFYYVFRVKSKLTFGELIEKWRTSEDKREHKYLVSFLDHPGFFLKDLKANPYDSSKIAETKSKTTLENVGSILPPCAISVLAHYVQQEGMQWAQQAQRFLEVNYDLTSCFNKK